MKSVYVALGDGLSTLAADVPGARGAASLLFRNDDQVWPSFRQRDLVTRHPGWTALVLARAGSTLDDVIGDQLAGLEAQRSDIALITLTVGGPEVAQLRGCSLAVGEEATRRFGERAFALLTRLQKLSARILVSGLVDPLGSTLAAITDQNSTAREVLALHDGMLHAVCDHLRVPWLDARTAFARFAPRGPRPSPSTPEVPSSTPWVTVLGEPTARGAHELRRRMWDALETPSADAGAAPVSGEA